MFTYKFINPLRINTINDVKEIREVTIDLNELSIKDLIDVEKVYNKIVNNNIVPAIQREYTNCYHAAVLEILLQKQYPDLLIASRDVKNIAGEDARNILFIIKSMYLNVFLSQSLEIIDNIIGDIK